MKLNAWFRFWLVGMTLAIGMAPQVEAQGTLFTLFTNGPSAKRINIVVLAEGYTTNQTTLFLYDATNAINNLLAQQPYQEYRGFFNAYAIFVPSLEAGSDHPFSGTFKNTFFNSTFDSYGIPFLLTIPPNDWNGAYAQGQGKVDTVLATHMPEYDLVVILVNDPEYGGSGGATLLASVNVFSADVIVHESGHTFAGLADEYSTAYPIYIPVEMPNATMVTTSNAIKWRVWIPPGTPIPTPESQANLTRVGLYEGAQYQTTGWYRPKMDCKMRSAFVEFCEVCSEQLVKSIYTRLKPIDNFSPTAKNLAIYSTQAVVFSVTNLQPLTHSLSIQWFTNNSAVPGATNPTFSLLPKSLGNGARTVKAVVRDQTLLVRNDPANVLGQTNTWNLTISLNELALVSARYLNTNRFRFTVTGSAPQGFVIQASTNLLNWTPISTNNLSGGKFDFTNSSPANFNRRYYRTVSPP